MHPHSSKEGDKAAAALHWRAGAMYGTALLQELVRHSHHDALRAWATAAPAVQSAVTDALSAAPGHSNEGMATFAIPGSVDAQGGLCGWAFACQLLMKLCLVQMP